MRIHATLIAVLLACFLGTSAARAQNADTREGIASTGLCGLVGTAYPTCPERWAVAANAGYGYTESVGNVPGAHHRLMGSVGGGVVPLPWLAVALRLDGRIDLHPHDNIGKDVTGTGDPRLFVRGGYDLKRDASIGGELVVWAPGNTAPSFVPKAISPELKVLAAWRPRSKPFALLGHVGYRLDNSAKSSPDPNRLRQGDRLALGLSDYDAVLIGVGASVRMIEKTELFAEVGLDALIDAPSFNVSPMRATIGARYFLPHDLQGEAALTGVFSSRPDFALGAPLVPVEPRVSFTLGVRYGRLLHPPPPQKEQPVDEPVVAQPEQPKAVDLRGRILDDKQEAVPDVRVVLTVAPETTLREAVTDGEGTYEFLGVPVGDATLEASAPGFQTQQWVVEVRPDMPPPGERSLVRKSDTGTLRLLTRTFSSEPLAATITVRDARGRKAKTGKADASGSYEIDLPPGRYTVMISAPGYRPLRREVMIDRYGVAILNVDMREEK